VRATRLLIPQARELHLNSLWITTDPDNVASRRSCELDGATLIQQKAAKPSPENESAREGVIARIARTIQDASTIQSQ
jgi:predicted acetyltransferase